jgi:hypothetical protein
VAFRSSSANSFRTIAEERIEPTSAASSRVAGLAPRAVSHSVVQRLSRLSASAREVARAAAVRGEGDLRLAADLAGVDPSIAATAADELSMPSRSVPGSLRRSHRGKG